MKQLRKCAIMMLAMAALSVMVSCGNDEDELPEIISSEIVDTGLAQDITVNEVTGTNGTQRIELAYKSWIKVNSQTRASQSDVYTVLLKDMFHNTDTTITIDDDYFNIGDYTTDISYRVKGTRRDGFVTITDSVMVYTVSFEDFSFEYELEYEVAVYDDGITKETMPYHKIKNIRDNGMEMVPLESIHDESLTVYARRQIDHSISVDLCGETYTLKGKVILQATFGTAFEPYVQKSQLISSYYLTVGEQVYSELRLKRWWSDGHVKTETVSVPISAGIDDYLYSVIFYEGLPENLEMLSAELGEVYQSDPPMYLLPYVYSRRDYRMFNITYEFLSFGMRVSYNVPQYYDGYLLCDFPIPEFKNFRFSDQQIITTTSGETEIGKYQTYRLIREVKADFDKLECNAQFNIGLVVYE